jgi:phosphoribosyl 1,2-cyclic phosphodiesterase
MALYFTSLNSGSNGNAYYIANEEEAVLIDAGITCKTLERRLRDLALNPLKIKAIFVSHEHSDHIKGLATFSSKFNLPVYGNQKTLGRCFGLSTALVKDIHNTETIVVGNLQIKAFSKRHDAIDPISFTVQHQDTVVGVFTDIGKPCSNLVNHFKLCDAAFLEANYDDEMLHSGTYPDFLKRRICGGQGHLSNKEALAFFLEHKTERLQCLLLAHLSGSNNAPQIVEQLFEPHSKNLKILVASRQEAMALQYVKKVQGKAGKKSVRPTQLCFDW